MHPYRMQGIRWAFNSEAWKPTKQEWLMGLSCVQSEEKERIQKFMFKKDAKLSLIGRLLLRKAITELLDIPYDKINLGRTDKGKPFLENETKKPQEKDLSFNISHQGNYTVLAAEPYRQVGVDVMKTTYPGGTDVPGFFHIMRKQFTSLEWIIVKNHMNEWDQLEMFYRLWCLKESYVKAVGVGIGHDLQDIEFKLKTQQLSMERIACDSCLYLKGFKNKDWSFQETKLDDLHQVSVALGPSCADAENFPPQRSIVPFKFLSFEDVISSATSLRPFDKECWEAFQSKRESRAR